ncbi:hypothetical protein [Marmoricola sp. RAF53]|uniref:hypothetical protein n=1 Tax=Marmoricola sp. RAF53 TaxID=3233059 RepID=UPI003F99D1C1
MGNSEKSTRARVATIIAALGVLVMSSGAALMASAGTANAAQTGGESKPAICHPVNGKGETKTGWNIISPNKASSHIDESLYPNGHYWKHESKDGRHDEYAVNGACPSPSTPPTEPTVITPTISYADPDCENPQRASFTLSVDDLDNIDAAITKVVTGAAAVGGSVQVTVSPKDGFAFPDNQESIAFPLHNFNAATECGGVQNPKATPVAPTVTAGDCTTEPSLNLPAQSQAPARMAATLADLPATINNVLYTLVEGTLTPGSTVKVKATPANGFEFNGEAQEVVYTLEIPAAGECPEGTTPTPVAVPETEVVVDSPESGATPTVVSAGLVSADDLRDEQGLALVAAGMALLVVAGGLGLIRPRGGKSQA